MKKIGILICGHVRDELVGRHGEYGRFFERLLADDDFTFIDYFAIDRKLPDNVNDCDAYILTGSAHGVYEDLAFIPPLEDFIRRAYEASVPQVGVCFGHQILAQALGGKVAKFEGGWGLGVHNYTFDLGEGEKTIPLNAVHQDQVIEKPKEAIVIGSSVFCRNAALSYGRRAISFQPHPEFDASFMRDLIELRRGKTFPDSQAELALTSLSDPVANDEVAIYIKKFLRNI